MNTKINAVLVDDEQDSLIAIQEQFKFYCPEVNIMGAFDDPEDALENILDLKPDVAFLDIRMPKLNGLELARRISPIGVKIIFITGYDEYAIDAIKLSALDYLLKPLHDASELQAAITKVINLSSQERQLPVFGELLENENQRNFSQETEIALADQKAVSYYKIEEIIRLKADKNYCQFFFTGGRDKVVSKNLGTFIDALKKYNLVQVNRSEVINLKHRKKLVTKDGPYLIMSDGAKVKVTDTFRKNLDYYKDSVGSKFTLFFKKA